MRTQRSIRRLKPGPVDDALVIRLIELAEKAPTGGNAKNWEFVVVRESGVKERLGRLNGRAWRVYGGIGRLVTRGRPNMQRILDAVDWQAEHFAEIPVVVVACLRGVRPTVPPIAASSYYGSSYRSVQNLLLAARAGGLGAGLITLPLGSTWLARRALGLPWNATPCAVVPCAGPGVAAGVAAELGREREPRPRRLTGARVDGAVRRCRLNKCDHPFRGHEMRERLERELAQARAELKAHMASWEYAFAMGSSRGGGREHPLHWATRARTEELMARCRELRARLAEYEA